MRPRAILLIFVIGLFTTATAQRRANNVPPDIAALEKRIKVLEDKVFDLNYKLIKDNSVELDISSDSYQRVNSNNGTFLVRVMRAEPYLNGYKVFLAIGNMTMATFSGFDLTLRWSTKEPDISSGKWLQWLRSRKVKEEHFTQDLLPGRWNQVDVILTPARADELGYLEVSLATNVVSLRQ